MKTETALTAFCITTVALIVGLVVITSFNLPPTTTGQAFIGIPVIYEGADKPSDVVQVKADASDPLCYQKGITLCQKENTGRTFVWCADDVAHQCGIPHKHQKECSLRAGFELKYQGSRQCRYGVIDECAARCPYAEKDQCVKISKGRCSLIGGRFQDERERNRYTYSYTQ